jgi:peptidoglycan/LPS O-acetylase OafA/YrhL
MSDTTVTVERQRRIVLLDALRLLAALIVLCFHWLFRGTASGDQTTQIITPTSFAMYGYIGVDWFFIISGFVIAWTAEGRTAFQFLLARFIRIYPAFVICMSLTFIGTLYFLPHFATVSVKDWMANLLILAPVFGSKLMDGAYWSIVIELIFYAWVFVFMLLGLFQGHRRSIAIGWLVIALINQQFLHLGLLRLLGVTEFAPWFILGMMLHDMWKKSVSTLPLLILASAFVASCITLLDQLVVFAKDYGQYPVPIIVLSLNGLGLALVTTCICVTTNGHAWTRLAGLAGALSYPLYLLHQHLGYMLIDWMAPVFGALTAFLLTFVAITSVACGVAFAIEPIIRQKLTICLSAITQGTKTVAPVVFRASRLQ